jgi:hypothetical protein
MRTGLPFFMWIYYCNSPFRDNQKGLVESGCLGCDLLMSPLDAGFRSILPHSDISPLRNFIGRRLL